MPFFDMPLDQLRHYRGNVVEPADFDSFWLQTLSQARVKSSEPRFVPRPAGMRGVRIFDLHFGGYNGQEVRAWFVLPHAALAEQFADASGRLPCVVEFVGYGGGRGYPHSWLHWANLGIAFCILDSRAQAAWRRGDTADPDSHGASSAMILGIQSPETYYYRRLMSDAVRLVETAAAHPEVDPGRMYLTGISQGGGLTIAAAGIIESFTQLSGSEIEIKGMMPDVPFLCDIRHGVELTGSKPYSEVSNYLAQYRHDVEQVFETLSYFDGVNFAKRSTASARYSVALMDDVCPASTVFAAYNHHAGAKVIDIFAHNRHEGGGELQEAQRFRHTLQLEGRSEQAAEIDYV